MFPVSEANLFCVKKTWFSSHSGHKTAAPIDDNGDPKMVFSYRSSSLDLPVVLVDCEMKGCES